MGAAFFERHHQLAVDRRGVNKGTRQGRDDFSDAIEPSWRRMDHETRDVKLLGHQVTARQNLAPGGPATSWNIQTTNPYPATTAKASTGARITDRTRNARNSCALVGGMASSSMF